MKNNDLTKAINNSAWFKHWFDSSFYHKLYANRDEKEAADFIDELLLELNPRPRTRMLDLGCGMGRHSRYLASKGFDVTGLDLAASSIRNAKKWEAPSLRFYQHDMRIPFGKHAFDFVFNFFTSFGYFKDPLEDAKVINNISLSLKPEGLLVMDYINSVHAEKKLVPTEQKEIDGIIYTITRWADEKYFFKKINVEGLLLDETLEFTEQVRKFSYNDFDDLFSRNGLQITDVLGDYQLKEYIEDVSPRIILIAKKSTRRK